MTTYTKKEIALVLAAAEVLNQKRTSQKINVSTFCKEADISRKNAYKHKKHFELSQMQMEQKIQLLQQENQQIQQKLQFAEDRAQQADLNWELRNILVALHDDLKKNGAGKTAKRQRLINSYNNISSLLGLKPLNFWA